MVGAGDGRVRREGKPMTGPYDDERLYERELDPPDTTTNDDEARADEWDNFNDD